MRVVLSTPRSGWGGSATVGMSLAEGLEARGHSVVVFCKPGSEIHRAVDGRFACEPILKGVDFPPPAIWRCRRAFRRHGTQVVVSLLHMDLRLTGAAARLAGLRLVARRAEMEPFSRRPDRRPSSTGYRTTGSRTPGRTRTRCSRAAPGSTPTTSPPSTTGSTPSP